MNDEQHSLDTEEGRAWARETIRMMLRDWAAMTEEQRQALQTLAVKGAARKAEGKGS